MTQDDDRRVDSTRRTVLHWSVTAGLVGLAGCEGTDDQDQPTESPEPEQQTATPTRTRTETQTETQTETTTTTAEAPADSWPMFNHDRLNSGHNASADGPTEAVESRWAFETDGPVRSSPAVVRGTVYVGSDDGHVYAIDADTGDERWRFETGGPVVSSPAYLQNAIYVGSDDRRFYALHAETGEKLWASETDGKNRSSPTVAADLDVPDLDGVVGFGSDDGSIYYLDPESGDRLQVISTDGRVVTSPVMYITSGGYYEIGAGSTDGTTYWWVPDGPLFEVNTLDAAAPVYASMSSVPDRTENIWYRAHDDGTISKRVFEHSNQVAWTFETGGSIRTTPVLASDLVYVGSRDGTLYAIDRESGEQAWAVETGAKIDSSAAVATQTVYVGSDDQVVYALDAETGDVRWTFETGGAVRSSPAVARDTVYVGSSDGSVYALGEPSDG